MTAPARLFPAAVAARLAAAVGLTAVAAVLLPPDPLAETLLGLPGILFALEEIHRRGVAAGGRRLAPRGTVCELVAVAVLAVAALARPHLGVELAPEAIVAGLTVVLAHRTLRQAVALRPLLGRRLPDRPSALFFALPFVVYLALLPWSTSRRPPDGDEPFYLLITHSLVHDFDADLTNNYAAHDARHFVDRELDPQPGDPVGPRGELYSRHNLALPLMLAPAYAVAGRLGALATMALMTAALAWMTLRLGRHEHRERPGEVLWAWALVAFLPPVLFYSHQVWVEVPAALLGVVALDQILDLRRRGGWRLARWVGIGLPVVLLPLLKIRLMVLAVPLLALAWWHAGRPRRPLIYLAAAFSAVGGAILVHNWVVFHNVLKYHTWGELEVTRDLPAAFARGFVGLFYDAGFGLFAAAPLWLILVPGLVDAVRRLRPGLFDLAVYALPYAVLVATRLEWYGGWSPPFRYLLVALPQLALLAVPVLARRRAGGARALVAGLAAATLALAVLWIAVPGWTYNFADGRTDLLDLASERLGADVARLFPSGVRPRLATWLWPLATFAVLPLLWRWPRRVPRPALWGSAAALAAVAATVVAAERLPTRVVELEDPWVVTEGGHLYPDRWVVARPRFRCGWVIGEGALATVPVVAGGREVSLGLEVQLVENRPGPTDLELRAGGRVLATWRARGDRVWTRLDLGPFPWPRGEPLVLAVRPTGLPWPGNAVLVDRVEMDWR